MQTTTAPGALGTFSYNIAAPANVTAGTYRFNGDLVLSSTGEKIHPEGYYQDATVGGGGNGATITSLTPNSGTTAGGTNVVIAGSGIVCTPAFPAVSFGGTNATVSSCGSTSVTAVSPAHAPGAVTVTLTNSGGVASNGLTYSYQDTSAPTFTGIAVAGSLITATFSEPVCRVIGTGAWAAGDWTINNISSGTTDIQDIGDGIPTCTAAADNGVTSAVIDMGANTITPGAFVEVTLNARGVATTTSDNEAIQDAAGNRVLAPQARQATAQTPETTPPTLASASGAVSSSTITLNFSEPVYCSAGWTFTAADITVDDTSSSTDPVANGVGSNACGSGPTTADSSFSFSITPSTLKPDTTYTVTITPENNDIRDVAGNSAATPQTVTFVSGAADFTPPTIVDARMSASVGFSDFTDAGDAFTLTFSEAMTAGDNAGSISLQDQDGTVRNITCNATNVACVWNTAKTLVTVTLVTVLAQPVSDTGTTPGMQIPFNVTALTGVPFTDTQSNAVNVLGSPDRLVDFE